MPVILILIPMLLRCYFTVYTFLIRVPVAASIEFDVAANHCNSLGRMNVGVKCRTLESRYVEIHYGEFLSGANELRNRPLRISTFDSAELKSNSK